jgi:hypothetical protein
MPPRVAEGEDPPSYVTAEAPRCGGGGALAEPGAIHSPSFTYPFSLSTHGNLAPAEAVYSSVHIALSAARADQDIASDRTVGVRDCIGRVLRAARGNRGPLVRATVIVTIRPDPLPRHASFALTVMFHTVYLSAKPGGHRSRLDSARSNFNLIEDILGFASGPAEITLTDLHESGRLPSAKERRLLSLLYTRAEAQAP